MEEWILSEAEEGNSDAQYILGRWYQRQNKPQISFEWYEKAAKSKHKNALCCLGDQAYLEKDYEQASSLFRQAAEERHAKACERLGDCYWYGRGVGKHEKKAFQWYLRSAELGNPEAQCHVGTAYDSGTVVKYNKEKALKWYEKAADNGDKLARVLLRVYR